MRLVTVLDQTITKCSLELMKTYGVGLRPEPEKTGNRVQAVKRAAVIGYNGGHKYNGSMALCVNNSLLEKTGPYFQDQTDWLGELSNQLMGRILNKMVLYGLELLQGTPVVIEGNPLDMIFSAGRTTHYCFTDDKKELCMTVFFDTSFPENLEVSIINPSAPSMMEGETVIF